MKVLAAVGLGLLAGTALVFGTVVTVTFVEQFRERWDAPRDTLYPVR